MSFENFIFDMRSIVTVLSFIAFIGIVIWAYSKRRKSDFDEAARLPFADEENDKTRNSEQDHG